MVVYDKLGRTWQGKKIVWIKYIDSSRMALYRWVIRDGERKLVYDKKQGMCDYKGVDVRDSNIELVPALEGKDGTGWQPFPNTKEATYFKKSLTRDGFVEVVEMNENELNDFDDEYEDEKN